MFFRIFIHLLKNPKRKTSFLVKSDWLNNDAPMHKIKWMARTEAAVQRCFVEERVLKNLQNSQGNICGRASFLIKSQAWGNIAKLLRTHFFTEYLRWRLLLEGTNANYHFEIGKFQENLRTLLKTSVMDLKISFGNIFWL